jgi:hypothetical protein
MKSRHPRGEASWGHAPLLRPHNTIVGCLHAVVWARRRARQRTRRARARLRRRAPHARHSCTLLHLPQSTTTPWSASMHDTLCSLSLIITQPPAALGLPRQPCLSSCILCSAQSVPIFARRVRAVFCHWFCGSPGVALGSRHRRANAGHSRSRWFTLCFCSWLSLVVSLIPAPPPPRFVVVHHHSLAAGLRFLAR